VIRPALVLLALATVIGGLLWPLALLPFGQPLAADAVFADAREPQLFWGRPTTATPLASSGSNLGPTNPAWLETVRARATELRAAHPSRAEPVPAELVTISASGLDPHVSPAGARYQVDRVAAARHVDPAALEVLIERLTEPRLLGIFGEPRVNVRRLNAALAQVPTPP